MAGRPPKPIALVNGDVTKKLKTEREEEEKKLKGNSDKIEKPPTWLSKNAKKEYRKIIEEIKNLDIVTNIDIDLVAIIADLFATIKECEKMIQEQGLFIEAKNSRGYTQILENPAFKTKHKCEDMLKKYLAEVPIFSPSGRAKMSILSTQKKEEDNDVLLQVLKGKDIDL